jgi:hypothetical protein
VPPWENGPAYLGCSHARRSRHPPGAVGPAAWASSDPARKRMLRINSAPCVGLDANSFGQCPFASWSNGNEESRRRSRGKSRAIEVGRSNIFMLIWDISRPISQPFLAVMATPSQGLQPALPLRLGHEPSRSGLPMRSSGSASTSIRRAGRRQVLIARGGQHLLGQGLSRKRRQPDNRRAPGRLVAGAPSDPVCTMGGSTEPPMRPVVIS